MESTHSIASPWKFLDGKEYLVSLGVSENPKSISISISDKITAAEWSSTFDFKYIETLTQRTGNYKPFDTFAAMIRCAILKKSDAVTLDLMSYEDLITLRDKKKRLGQGNSGLGLEQNFGKYDVASDSSTSEFQRQAEKTPKKYLIVTYIAEFDKVHYPLKLNYTGLPDVTIMQQTILKLKNEVDHLKNSNYDLMGQLKVVLKPSKSSSAKYGEKNNNKNNNGHLNDSYNSTDDFDTDADHTEGDHNGISKTCKLRQDAGENLEHLKKINSLATHVVHLEQQLEHERAEHEENKAKLLAENDFLHAKIKTIEASESILQQKVSRLESVLALNIGLRSTKNEGPTPEKSCSYIQNNNKNNRNINATQRISRTTGRGPANTPNNSKPNSRNNSVASRCSSISIGSTKLKNDSAGSNNVSRSSSFERKSFNPTEYVKQKKLKQERMAQMRMQRIESRMQADRRNSNSKGSTLNNNNSNDNCNNSRKVSTADGINSNPTVTTSPLQRKRSSHNDLPRMGSEINRSHTRNPSSDSQRSSIIYGLQFNNNNNTKSPSKQIYHRPSSPSPNRNGINNNIKSWRKEPLAPERNSRRKTRIATRDFFIDLNKKTSIDQLLDNVRQSYNQEDDQNFTKFKRQHEKTDRTGLKKAESNLSFEKLQRRLQTIQAYMRNSKGKKSNPK